MSLVYLNGTYLPLEEACVSVLDRGFMFGDGAYEVIPVYGGGLFQFNEHLARLSNSLSSIYIKNPHSTDEWREIIYGLLERNPKGGNQSIYLQVTRGTGVRDHIYNEDIIPTIFVMCKNNVVRDFSDGVSAVTHEDIRWQYCHIKAISLLPGVILKNHAKNVDGSFEAILIRDGYVTEGSASNVFVVKDGLVKTSKKDNRILSGITRELVIEILNDSNIDCEETNIAEYELNMADEIWISSSTMGIVPVVKLNGNKVGDGKPGEIWMKAKVLYEDFKLKTAAN